jgi:lipoprotein-anchoring transpeptidase ErfK/SrfK
MRRLIIGFAAAIAATSAFAFTNTPADDQPNAKLVIDGAFTAMAAASPGFTPANTLAFAPPDPAASGSFEMPAKRSAAPAVDTPASAPANTPAPPSIVITVNKSTQRMSVRVNGVERWNWAVSTGRRGYSTPGGAFKAFRMVRDHKSREWDNAPMPYSIFFTTRGHAIHGSFATGRLGSPASHGCVRLDTANARQLFALVQQHGVTNTAVIVTGMEQAPAAYARVNAGSKKRNKSPSAQRTKTQQQRLAQQTHRPPPGYQPQHYSRPMQIAPRGFAPLAQ